MTCWTALQYLLVFSCVLANVFSEDCPATLPQEIENSDLKDCVKVDDLCLAPWDVLNYEAVRTIHSQLDDDHNGDIDLAESVDFLREELNYTKDVEKKQEVFHHNNDQHISVQELWTIWFNSEVYNWTTEQTVNWLTYNVELGQYSNSFYVNYVNGSMLPRLATNYDQILREKLGIKNAAHRSKISIKAMDVVLFGSPKDTASYAKDITIVLLVTFLVVGTFRFLQVQREFRNQRRNMIREMDALHEEERTFREELKQRDSLSRASIRRSSKADVNPSGNSSDDQVDDEDRNGVEFGLGDDGDIVRDGITPGSPLQMWLQLTYAKEKDAFEQKCKLLEAQLEEAKDMAERLKPSKKQVFVALGLVHGKTEPKYDAITEAVRRSITNIKLMHKEIGYRWDTIEKLTRLDIVNNPGLDHLEFLLEPEMQCPNKTPPSNEIALGAPFKLNGARNRLQKKTKGRASPETASIKSSSSYHSRESSKTFANLRHINTIATGLGGSSADVEAAQDTTSKTTGSKSGNSPAIESPLATTKGTPFAVNGKELKKQDTASSIASSINNQSASDSKVTSAQEASDKCPSAPALDPTESLDGSVIAETDTVLDLTSPKSHKSRNKFFPAKLFSFRASRRSKKPSI